MIEFLYYLRLTESQWHYAESEPYFPNGARRVAQMKLCFWLGTLYFLHPNTANPQRGSQDLGTDYRRIHANSYHARRGDHATCDNAPMLNLYTKRVRRANVSQRRLHVEKGQSTTHRGWFLAGSFDVKVALLGKLVFCEITSGPCHAR